MSEGGGGNTSSVTLTIDADTARYIAGIARAAKANEKLGESGSRAMRKFTGQMTETIVKALTLREALERVASTYNEINRQAEQMSRTKGKETLDLAASLARSGITRTTSIRSVAENAVGATTLDQRLAFAGRLAQDAAQTDDRGRRALALSEQDVAFLTAQYARGGDVLFGRGGEDLIRSLTDRKAKGTVNERMRRFLGGRFGEGVGAATDAVGAAIGTLDEDVQGEMAVVAEETFANARERSASSEEAGRRERRITALQKARRAEMGFARRLAFGAAERIAPETTSALDRATLGTRDEAIDLLKDLRDTNRRMAEGTPQVGARGETAP